ncbi:MAG TPA: ATPase, T2SS/T4P/T4SS family, partial [Planctomycetaceae bacterium]|nr:ATPase, T2SS/T4P/T4SS family [Planctomycetaceae bacterium]
SAFVQSGKPHVTLRLLPERIPGFEELNLPANVFEELGQLQSGLVLVAGVTGSGKSTTVAALVDWINTNRPLHIITLEDPIEYRHLNRKSILSQRNVGTDVFDLPTAIYGALRQDPDIIVIGELRDAKTIQAAINAASTGHLVIGTMHANTAADVVGRLLSFFAPSERDLVRLQLREALQCVICQRLVPRIGGGRVPALELLFNDTSVMSEALASGNASSVRTAMQQTLSRSRLFETDLKRLTQEKVIAYETGQAYATDTSVFEQMVLGTYAPPTLDSMRYDYKG